jgi:hypothetical protein
MSNKTKLPDEVVELLRQKAKDYAQVIHDEIGKKKHFHRKTLMMYAHLDGATEYAIKLHEAQQENEQLRRWKTEAAELLTKINSYAHKHLEIKLGQCAVDFVIAQAKERDELKQENERLKAIANLWRPLMEEAIRQDSLYGHVPVETINKIKRFLYGE